jgi:CBS-domain-containing membrane protein
MRIMNRDPHNHPATPTFGTALLKPPTEVDSATRSGKSSDSESLHGHHLHRWSFWRAQLSVPFLLAHGDEKSIVSVFTAINGGLTILIISLLAWLCDLPLLFAALGPTSFILHSTPLSRRAAPRSIILGHFTGIACGAASLVFFSVLAGETITLDSGGAALCSASLALAATCFFLVRWSCPHPPACASALVVALGAASTWTAVLCMAAAVVLVTAQAFAFNRLACLPVPLWILRPRNMT